MLAARESLPWHNAGRTCCEQDREEMFWVSFSFFFFLFLFFTTFSLQQLVGMQLGLCMEPALQLPHRWAGSKAGLRRGVG